MCHRNGVEASSVQEISFVNGEALFRALLCPEECTDCNISTKTAKTERLHLHYQSPRVQPAESHRETVIQNPREEFPKEAWGLLPTSDWKYVCPLVLLIFH